MSLNGLKDGKVWIVDDDQAIRWVLERALNSAGIETESFDAPEKVLAALEHNEPAVLISDVRMPGMSGLELLKAVHERQPDIPVIIMTAHSDLDSAVSSYQSGAFEYLPKPFDIDEAVALVKRGQEHRQQQLAETPTQETSLPGDESTEIIGEAPAMQEVFRAIGRLSHSNITVLINGESGTGKELVARALHRHSPRADRSFIALNMAAIPRDLIESELFGHEKGAFTGAGGMRRGRFEQAGGGTLFLDEIGDMPADTQTRLLRVLADGEFYRVGGYTPVKADVRIIAATHQHLEKLVAEGKFREDLFHRLNVIRVHLPRLKDRREDIPGLARFFLDKAGKELEVEPKVLHPETASYISTLAWPGNVRQLENTCRWLTVMASGREVLVSDLPPELIDKGDSISGSVTNDGSWQQLFRQWCDHELAAGHVGILDQAVPDFESIAIESALVHTGGRKKDAAELLGWGRNTLTRKIKELNPEPPTSVEGASASVERPSAPIKEELID
ncbi:nitrogen regulation protein NR(I) [Endozoicomonas sp. SCSIO W0465]|uniref:nitrogen regulation protein NR(I) n=1 Tax=Endozoicomonas sp. SCSIO W0465 TaxID=2918516 RepID=UPI0020756E3F|nr:nitrogen regulation protein NR(I) [Endozoicomonas sp. SCSIO W0465]USE37066.1 nitrogen regulation protein NR(I) [Endozoicomonas sp. SCSIO W0465]